jgi:hypothetical protein
VIEHTRPMIEASVREDQVSYNPILESFIFRVFVATRTKPYDF